MADVNCTDRESFSVESLQRMNELFELLDELRQCVPNPAFDELQERQNFSWAIWAWLRIARGEFARIEAYVERIQ